MYWFRTLNLNKGLILIMQHVSKLKMQPKPDASYCTKAV